MMSPFFPTQSDRVSLARRRYFEEGILPTGAVSEAIFQSWSRCHRSGQLQQDKIEFQAVSTSRNQLSLQKNRVLHAAWLNELPALSSALGFANCSVILTDATGVLIGASPFEQREQRIIPTAHRAGINLSEEYVGTSAPAIVIRTGKSASVLGSEHYFEAVSPMYCAAAPIRNIHGQLAGVLDISSEGVPFQFDLAAVVGLYAASIENRLLLAQSQEHLVVKFQFIPAIIDTPMVGMLGFDLSGRLVWLNSIASQLLGIHSDVSTGEHRSVEEIFDANFSQLASVAGRGVVAQRLRNGLHIFMTCEVRQNKGGASAMSPVAAPISQLQDSQSLVQIVDETTALAPACPIPPPAASLKQADADLIQKYLAEYNGNLTKVARRLKVSRGLIYRRLNQLAIDPNLFRYGT
jgi:sigma-54 dependent transcriptional regulator, acetoin dehydrogenase operon transcriptional activator AcoR